MLSENVKKDIQEIILKLMELDSTSRMLMLSNATVLLAKQEIDKNKKELEFIDYTFSMVYFI